MLTTPPDAAAAERVPLPPPPPAGAGAGRALPSSPPAGAGAAGPAPLLPEGAGAERAPLPPPPPAGAGAERAPLLGSAAAAATAELALSYCPASARAGLGRWLRQGSACGTEPKTAFWHQFLLQTGWQAAVVQAQHLPGVATSAVEHYREEAAAELARLSPGPLPPAACVLVVDSRERQLAALLGPLPFARREALAVGDVEFRWEGRPARVWERKRADDALQALHSGKFTKQREALRAVWAQRPGCAGYLLESPGWLLAPAARCEDPALRPQQRVPAADGHDVRGRPHGRRRRVRGPGALVPGVVVQVEVLDVQGRAQRTQRTPGAVLDQQPGAQATLPVPDVVHHVRRQVEGPEGGASLAIVEAQEINHSLRHAICKLITAIITSLIFSQILNANLSLFPSPNP
eukprot:g14524.t1